MTRLPGHVYAGPDPDGFMTAAETVRMLERYARSFGAPVHGGTTVESVRRVGEQYEVVTDRGVWSAPDVIIATGACDRPAVPDLAEGLSARVHQVDPRDYRNPAALPAGGVLVVGAGATGVQIADELVRAGRDVVIAAGRHTRLPRRYRGRDIFAWLEETGLNATPAAEVRDRRPGGTAPSSQLLGNDEGANLDLGVLARDGVVVAGRLSGIDGSRVTFADDLAENVARAEVRLDRVLTRIDRHLGSTDDGARPAPVTLPAAPTELDLRAAGIDTVIWATGYRREYPWLHVPVLDPRGEIVHRGGITAAPGLSVLGLPFERRRNSHFIDGVGADARALVDHICRRVAPGRGLTAADLRHPPDSERNARWTRSCTPTSSSSARAAPARRRPASSPRPVDTSWCSTAARPDPTRSPPTR